LCGGVRRFVSAWYLHPEVLLDTPSLARRLEEFLLAQSVVGLLHERRQPEEPTILGHMVRNTYAGRVNLMFISVMISMAC